MSIPFKPFLYQQIEARAVDIVKEYLLTSITTYDHVVECCGVMNSSFTCHGWYISQ